MTQIDFIGRYRHSAGTETTMEVPSEVIVKITDLSRGGAGVARDETGRVVFVPFTAPGDTVRVRLLGGGPSGANGKKRYAQGELLEILDPSKDRQTPPCPVFGRCGGCQWQHIPYSVQWQTKSGGVLHALERMKIAPPDQPDLMPAEEIWNYRNRIQLRGEGDEIGFFAARSHERVPIQECFVARPEINRAIQGARDEGRSLPKPYKVEIEVLSDGSIRKIWNSQHAAGGFRQIHDQQNEKLKSWVADRIRAGSRVLDLYGGSGNLGAPVSLKAEIVECVDVTAPEGTTLASYPNLRFHKSPVTKWLRKHLEAVSRLGSAERFSTAILDPPREGLDEDFDKIASALEALGVREIIAVGCDPDSWARDVSGFLKRGWKLGRVGVLDLFPQTPHVESLALLNL
jgi:23S rRNA (uracil1939-C5)-methyltransferase